MIERLPPVRRRLLYAVAAAFAVVTLVLIAVGRPLVAVALPIGLGIAWTCVRRPAIAGALLASSSVANAASVLTEFHGLPSITEPLMALAIVSIVLRSVRSDDAVLLTPTLAFGFGLYAIIQLVSVFWAGDHAAATAGSIGTVRDMLVALVAVATISSVDDLLTVAGGVAAAGVFLGGLSAFQAASGTFSSPYGGFAVATVEQIVGEVDDFRASGPVDDPNFFAQVLVVAFALALGAFLFSKDRWLRVVGLTGAAIAALGILVTYSRGGVLAGSAVAVCALMMHRPTPTWTIVTIAAVLVSVAALPPEFVDRAAQSTAGLPLVGDDQPIADSAVRGRTSEAIVGLQMLRDHPVLGVGVGNYPARYQEYSRELGLDPRREDRASHNLYLEIGSETGVVGLGAFGVLVAIAVRSLRRATRDDDERLRTVSRSLLLAMIGFGVTGVFLHADFARTMWILVALSATAGAVAGRRRRDPGATDEIDAADPVAVSA